MLIKRRLDKLKFRDIVKKNAEEFGIEKCFMIVERLQLIKDRD